MTEKLTKIDGIPPSADAIPGMAHFANTGPFGRTCGECKHRGYRRQRETGSWDEVLQQVVFKEYRTQGCAKFKALTGNHGPAVDSGNSACKYFELNPTLVDKPTQG